MSMSDDEHEAEHAEFEQLKRNVLDALQEVLAGSSYSPPEGGVIVEAVICCVWMQTDGHNGMCTFPATNHWWSTQGILLDALATHQAGRGQGSVPGDDDD